MYEADFLISSRGQQLKNRTKPKIIGFSESARWISMKIWKDCLILDALSAEIIGWSKIEKNQFLEIFLYPRI